MSTETDTIYVNVSADLGRRIRDLATRERRTLKGQLEVLLERGLACADDHELRPSATRPPEELVA